MRNTYLSLLVVALCLACVASMSAATNVLTNPQVSKASFATVDSLRNLIESQPQAMMPLYGYHEASPVQYPKPAQRLANQKLGAFQDSAAQGAFLSGTIPTKQLDFLGVGSGFFGYSVPDAPTDGQISIGDTQIVQWVNVQFAVFDMSGNNLLFNGAHFANGNVLFTGLPHCGATNSGDIIVQFDKTAHRWVMYQPRFSAPYYDCFAVSKTADFLGGYFLYEFPTFDNANDFPDYPKVGVWPDGYYVSHNSFFHLQAYNGAMPCAYDRKKMLAGDSSAGGVCFLDTSNGTLFDDGMVPSDLDSAIQPPAGSPNIFMGSIDNFSQDSNIYYYHFHFDTTNYANSTFDCVNGACKIAVNTYQNAPGTVSEPGGSVIDTLSDRLMYRLAYRVIVGGPAQTARNVNNTVQSWLVSHAVNSGGHAAVRWYEFHAPLNSTTPQVFQQQTYDPDTTNRFMSSLAMDKNRNIAMSYTVSSSANNVHPTIAFTGRSVTDPLGTMGAEQIVITGTGSQTDTSNRWGDYYNMALSPVDSCTFVTTGEYYTTNSSFNWSTRNAVLKFSGCN
jgi:hypothetical protein